MLNRRILRSKAVQYLYGLLQSHTANYHLAIENIRAEFAPDMMTFEPQDKVQLLADAEESIKIFNEVYLQQKTLDPQTPAKIKKAVNNASIFVSSNITKDNKFQVSTLVSQTEEVRDSYIITLNVLTKVLEQIEENFNKKYYSEPRSFSIKDKLLENVEIKEVLYHEDTLEKVSDLAFLLYRDTFADNEALNDFYKNDLGDFEKERAIVKDYVRLEIQKHDLYETVMEEEDFDWSENRLAVKDLVNKTIKGLTPEMHYSDILIAISANWEDDKSFMKLLFENTIANKEEYTKYITEKLQNWDLNRIAEIDMAILLVAISEMVSFPSIPVKVTINEFLEISKEYSTPKSKEFINGLLDKISNDLIAKDIVKKTGRGLIDNK